MVPEDTPSADDLRDELLQEVEEVPAPATEEDVEQESQQEQARIRTEGLAQFYGLRVTWSKWLIGWISLLITFQVILTFAVGLKAVDFTGFETFLQLTVGQNFLQVVGLAIIVVRFLHSNKSEKEDEPPPL